MARFRLMVNGSPAIVNVSGDVSLLRVLREELALSGTNLGCATGRCGACTVHLNGLAALACVIPIANVRNRAVTTIEGLSPSLKQPLDRAWVAEKVMPCSYCQSGRIMAAAALLAGRPDPSDAQIRRAMRGTLCHCATASKIRRVVRRAAQEMSR